jgi:hypothetical protein
MKHVSHGGLCCGIGTIYSFYGPETVLPGITAEAATAPPMAGRTGSYYTLPRPAETTHQRFLAYLAENDSQPSLRGGLKSGLLEAVLRDSQRPKWEQILLDNGFKMVTEFYNSNSGNQVFVYHRVRDGRNLKAPPPARPASDPFTR